MYAVIETGGKQYRVEVGTELEVELLDAEAGQSITLERVLLVADDADATIGTPLVSDAAVEAEVVGRQRGDKVIAFKYQPKARRRVKKGHRQELTLLRIADIRFQGRSAAGDTTRAGTAKGADRKRLEEAAARQAAEDAALAAKLNVGAQAEAPARAEEAAEPASTADKPATPAAKAKPASRARATRKAPTSKVEVAAGTDAAESGTKGFEIYEDKAGEWRWRLRAANDELVAMSEEGFASKASVVRSLGVVRKNVAAAEDHMELTADDEAEDKTSKGFEIYEDKAGKWRWRLRAANGELLAIPEQGFASKAGVVKALDVVRRNVAAAKGHHEAGDDGEPTKAAPRRTRTKKDG
jgi:large subunit ribosomal protein L21